MTNRPSGPRIPTDTERAQDRDFILARHGQLAAVAAKAFFALGPGAIIVDQLESPPRIVYLPLERLPEGQTELRRMVSTYQPDRELVVLLLKSEGVSSTYRLKRHLPPDDADQHDVLQ
jgi:hypothetical protein